MISIVACCHGAKLCAHAARDFRSQQNGAVTRMGRSCWVQPSHKERAVGVVRYKKEGCCCNLSGGVALIVWFTTNGMCAKNKIIYAWHEQAMITESATHDLYCCLLPWCEALRTCRSGFPIAATDAYGSLHFLAIFSASLFLTLLHSSAITPLVVKTKGVTLFHVVGRPLPGTSQNETVR